MEKPIETITLKDGQIVEIFQEEETFESPRALLKLILEGY